MINSESSLCLYIALYVFHSLLSSHKELSIVLLLLPLPHSRCCCCCFFENRRNGDCNRRFDSVQTYGGGDRFVSFFFQPCRRRSLRRNVSGARYSFQAFASRNQGSVHRCTSRYWNCSWIYWFDFDDSFGFDSPVLLNIQEILIILIVETSRRRIDTLFNFNNSSCI